MRNYMKFLIAYIPYTEKWCVFSQDKIITTGLEEDKASKLASVLNSIEANYLEPQIRTIEQFDFEAIYSLYPRKLGKTIGIKRLKMKIKTKEKYDLLKNAAINFKNICEANGVDEKFIPHFATWTSKWEDYIPINEAGGIKQESLSLDEITKLIDN